MTLKECTLDQYTKWKEEVSECAHCLDAYEKSIVSLIPIYNYVFKKYLIASYENNPFAWEYMCERFHDDSGLSKEDKITTIYLSVFTAICLIPAVSVGSCLSIPACLPIGLCGLIVSLMVTGISFVAARLYYPYVQYQVKWTKTEGREKNTTLYKSEFTAPGRPRITHKNEEWLIPDFKPITSGRGSHST